MTVQHREPFPHLLGRLERLDAVDARAVLEGILGLLPHPAGGLLSYHDTGHRWLPGDFPRDRVRNLLPSAFEASVRVLHPLQNGQGPRGGRMLWKELADSRRLPAPGVRFVDLFPDELLQERRVEPRVGHLDPLTAILLSRILEHHTTQPDQVLFVFWGGLSFFQEDEVDPVYRGPLAVVDAFFTNDPRPWHLTPTIWLDATGGWWVTTHTDEVSTYVAGSRALMDEILGEGRIEALEVTPDTRTDAAR